MKAKLLKRLRKEVNMTFIHKGRYVYQWFNEDIDPNKGWGKGYNVIYECVSDDQAKEICEKERRDQIKKKCYRKPHKTIRRHINERLSKTGIL